MGLGCTNGWDKVTKQLHRCPLYANVIHEGVIHEGVIHEGVKCGTEGVLQVL